jgi:hypothetical protein
MSLSCYYVPCWYACLSTGGLVVHVPVNNNNKNNNNKKNNYNRVKEKVKLSL